LLLAALFGTPATAQAEDLAAAFARERAMLVAERDELARALVELRSAGERERRRAERELGTLAAEHQRLRTEARRIEAELGAAMRSHPLDPPAGGATSTEVVRSLEPALALLSRRGYPVVTEGRAAAEVLAATFAAAHSLLRASAEIQVAPGTFFDERGHKATGSILRVGAVAALGVGEGTGGQLAPAGGGQLAVVDPAGRELLRALLAGRPPGRVPLRLFEADQPEALRPADSSVVELLRSGGLLVWPILGLALLGLLVAIERLVTLQRAAWGARSLAARVVAEVRRGAWAAAADLCAASAAAVGPVLAAALAARQLPHQQRRDRVDEALLAQTPRLERNLGLLHVVAAVAPLLGLLGTVTGMIATFEVITTHGTGDPRLLAGGISEALVTTELGLVVAIPTLLIHAWLSARVDRLLDGLEAAALRVGNEALSAQAGPAPADPPPARAGVTPSDEGT